MVSSNTITYIYNNDNRMLSAGSDTFAYDLGGNMTEQKTDSGLTTYDWNYENMLTKITDPNSNITEYTYNGALQRTERDVSGTITKFLWDGFNVIAEYDGNNNQTVKYIQSLQIDKPIAQIRSSNYYYYHFDGLGSVTELTDANEAVQNSYRYKAFGESLSKTESITNEFQYTSRRNENNGLYYYRYRYYNSDIERFINWDLIGYNGGYNLFRYVGNDPIFYFDSLGLFHIIPRYGNFGGPGYPEGNPPLNKLEEMTATDSMDECFKSHDICYKEKGLGIIIPPSKKCDRLQCDEGLLNCLNKLPDDPMLWPRRPQKDPDYAKKYRKLAQKYFKWQIRQEKKKNIF